MRCWRRRAQAIPSTTIREDALKASTEQRSHIDGAALFTTLPRTRNHALLHLLVAYEVIWDFLDNVNERTHTAGVTNGLQLHQALIDALDHNHEISTFYKYSPGHHDGNYLRKLTITCRETYTRLPSYSLTREAIGRESTRALVCAINHDAHQDRRDQMLQQWATAEFQNGHEAQWFELTAAASTNLTIFALLTLAAQPHCDDGLISQTSRSYFPWISVLTAMLDSYVDQNDDAATGNHNYLSHYDTPTVATERLCSLIARCLQEAGSLKNAEKHILIASCMFAMYLTKACANKPPMRPTTRRLIHAGGHLTHLLTPIFTLWRRAYGLRDI
jgi:tetraprenyl-beta-curcumene synthase